MTANSEPYRQARNLVKGSIVIARVKVDDRIVERPAIVVRVWGPDMVNLRTFLDGSNDVHDVGAYNWQYSWLTSAHHSLTPEPNTWCWVDEQDMTGQGA